MKKETAIKRTLGALNREVKGCSNTMERMTAIANRDYFVKLLEVNDDKEVESICQSFGYPITK